MGTLPSLTANFATDLAFRCGTSENTEAVSFRNSSRPARREIGASWTGLSSISTTNRSGFPRVKRTDQEDDDSRQEQEQHEAAAKSDALLWTQPIT